MLDAWGNVGSYSEGKVQMMWSLCLLLALQPAPAGAVQPTPVPQPAQEAEAAPRYDLGPLHGEVIAMFDARYWYSEDMPGSRQSELRMQMRMSGEGIVKAARVGNVVFDEAVDDTGRALITAETYTDEERTETRALNVGAERLRSTGLMLGARMDAPSRDAKTVKLRGSVRVILASGSEEITIDNPLQYVGKDIENDRLKELGIQIRVLAPDVLAGDTPPSGQILVLQYVQGDQQIHRVELHDAWMKPMRHRERPMKTKDGEDVIGCAVQGGTVDDKTQLVLNVFQTIDDQRIPIVIDALKLP